MTSIDDRVPLTVVGGYLGAGKTTLINALLSDCAGLRLAVLVNDFGSINIDAALLKSASEDTIELTNGCVCCTMSGDLFYAIGDLLDRQPRPDQILVEASGIADPSRIAAVSLAEPDLKYGGIVSVVDGQRIGSLLSDERVAPQVRGQLACADVLVVSKARVDDPSVSAVLRACGHDQWISAKDYAVVLATMFAIDRTEPVASDVVEHPSYVQWSESEPQPVLRRRLEAGLQQMPKGIYRVKGIVAEQDGIYLEIHAVGQQWEVATRTGASRVGVTAIGLGITREHMSDWWSAITSDAPVSLR